jgi:hypothetical protein
MCLSFVGIDDFDDVGYLAVECFAYAGEDVGGDGFVAA